MSREYRVGKKGQFVVSKEIRDTLGLQIGQSVAQRVAHDGVQITFIPPEHNRSLAGSLAKYTDVRLPDDVDWNEIRDQAWADAIAEKMAWKDTEDRVDQIDSASDQEAIIKSKLSKNWNIYISKEIRDALGIEPGWVTTQTIEGYGIMVGFIPPEPDRSQAGSLSKYAKRPVSYDEDWNKVVGDAWVEGYLAGESDAPETEDSTDGRSD